MRVAVRSTRAIRFSFAESNPVTTGHAVLVSFRPSEPKARLRVSSTRYGERAPESSNHRTAAVCGAVQDCSIGVCWVPACAGTTTNYGSSRRRTAQLLVMPVGANIGPELVELGLIERALPGRHLPLAFHHELVEARALVGGEFAQIKR